DKDLSTLMTMYGNIMIQNDTEQVGADKDAKDAVWNNKRINNGSVYFNWEDYEPITFKYSKPVLVENSGLNKKS
ncbi:MAG: arylsulfatase, partial [Dialister sp.]|nr:arylsulfatase [Dialister sp.]